MAEETQKDNKPVVRAFSEAPGSIATMSNNDLMVSHPSAMDPAVIATVKARENGVKFMNLEQLAAARREIEANGGTVETMGGRLSQIFAAGDHLYHKQQKKEVVYLKEDKKPGMCLVQFNGQRFRVKKEYLVKI